jgi:hypothetical protein
MKRSNSPSVEAYKAECALHSANAVRGCIEKKSTCVTGWQQLKNIKADFTAHNEAVELIVFWTRIFHPAGVL